MKTACEMILPAQEGQCIFGINTLYTSANEPQLLQLYCEVPRSDTFADYYRRISRDNGRTWTEPERIYRPAVTEEGTWRWAECAVMYDAQEDVTLLFYNYALYRAEGYSHDRDAYTRLFYRLSRDGGRTFSGPVQLCVQGHDPINWGPGIMYGKSGALVSFCAPLRIGDQVVLPAMLTPMGSDYSGKGALHYSALCFLGRWRDGQLEWDMSSSVTVPPCLSNRGLYEPTIAPLCDGRWLMVMRGGNAGYPGQCHDPTPSYKWYSLSSDEGRTWSPPEPWAYDTGESFFSPASGSRLIRHSRTGHLYWIGNITPENPQGNHPRYPLVVAEVEEGAGLLRKASLRVVADRRPDQSEWIQFSNLRVYEDRESGEFVVTLSHVGERTRNLAHFDYTAPGYAHRFDPAVKGGTRCRT